ncbi:MAG: sugar ABC transporter permease [Bifidobacteriaceae bacterium]|jgi:multiple sugar transport system permease protein|nr:sugar ABC transporter permease [Bifidobacteriaceae bacterium]
MRDSPKAAPGRPALTRRPLPGGTNKPRGHLKYVAPTMTLMVVLSIIPTVFLAIASLTNYQLGWSLDEKRFKFVWFENYIRLFSGADKAFWHSVWISVLFMVLATGIEMVLGFWLASMLNNSDSKLKPLMIGIMMLPLAMTPSIAAQVWKLLFSSEYGLLNAILNGVAGVKVTWLGPEMAFWSILIVDIWQFTPFVALIIYAGLRSMPDEPFEAASLDGASRWQAFRYLTIPMLSKLLYLALLLRAVDALKLFDTAFVLTQGGPGNATEFLSLHVYRLANAQNGLIGRASAVAVVLLIVVMVVSRFLIKKQRKAAEASG